MPQPGSTVGASYIVDECARTETRKEAFKRAIRALEPIKDAFDTIVCRGYSGMAFGPVLAYLMDKQILMVRKDGESSHDCYKYLGQLGKSYLIVDDFIASGATMKAIMKVTHEAHARTVPAKFVGVYLYHPANLMSIAELEERLKENG